MPPCTRLCVLVAVAAAFASAARAAGDAANGQALYRARCSACHSADYNGVGPAHRGVFGRGAGKAAGFAYSPALLGAGWIWDEALLDRWLADPEKLAPGQRMGVNVPEPEARADLIAYLKQLGAKKE